VHCYHCGEDVVRLDPLLRFEDALAIYGEDYFRQMQGIDQSFRLRDFAEYGLLDFFSFVEFGPGGDQVLKWLRSQRKYVEAVDVNLSTLRQLRSEGIPAAMTPLELDRARFDVALSYHYLEHTRNPLLEILHQFSIADRVLVHIPIGLEELGNADHNWLLSGESVCRIVSRFGEIIRKDIRVYPGGRALQILARTKA
jgi:hypothetical protein